MDLSYTPQEEASRQKVRVLASAAREKGPGSETSLLKVKGSEPRQEVSALSRRALEPYAQPFLAEALEDGHRTKRELALAAAKCTVGATGLRAAEGDSSFTAASA